MKMLMALVMVLGIGFSSLSQARTKAPAPVRPECVLETPDEIGDDSLFNDALKSMGFFPITSTQAKNANIEAPMVLTFPVNACTTIEGRISDRRNLTLSEWVYHDLSNNNGNSGTFMDCEIQYDYQAKISTLVRGLGSCEKARANILPQ